MLVDAGMPTICIALQVSDKSEYDAEGVGRIIVLALMCLSAAAAAVTQGAKLLFTARVARPIDFYKDVLRGR
jgi:hypothetical protein